MHFAPDGQSILLTRTGDIGGEARWLLPFAGGRTPQRVLTNVFSGSIGAGFSWMRDSRHIAVSVRRDLNARPHLWIADTQSASNWQLTGGTNDQTNPAVSPDGKQIVYAERKSDLDIVNLSLIDGSLTKMIATDVPEKMAAWSLNTPAMSYVTERDGPGEIWMRTSDGRDRPLVTHQQFPENPVIANPALSPDGERIIFTRLESDRGPHTWIMSTSAAVPQRLQEYPNGTESVGSWSPDGSRFAELLYAGPRLFLAVTKIGSREKPAILRDLDPGISDLPAWSPTGDWITYHDKSGWNLISPDGKTSRSLGRIATRYLEFSKDGKHLYGIRTGQDNPVLFSLDIATQKITDIHELDKSLEPATDFTPGIRLSLNPDGKHITYTVATRKSNLWMLEGFRRPGGFLSRFGFQ